LKDTVVAMPKSRPRAVPASVARPKKVAAAGGSDEWEEF